MKNHNWKIILICLIITTKGYSQFNYSPDKLVPIDSMYKTGVLENGIKYIIKTHKVPEQKAYFYAFVNIGAMQEKPNEYGLSHLIEHLLYTPRKDIKQINYLNYLKSLGLSDNDLNANAGFESTVFKILNVPVQNDTALITALLLLKEIVFNPVIDNSCVAKDKKIVCEEWRIDQNPSFRMDNLTNKTAFKGSKYSRPGVIGDTAMINRITLKDVKDFHKKWYKPDLLTIIAIGDFDTGLMEMKIKQIFNVIPKATFPTIKVLDTIPNNRKPVIIINNDNEISQNEIEIHYRHNNLLIFNQKQLKDIYIDKLIEQMISRRINSTIKNKNNNPVINAHASYNNQYLDFPEFNEYEFTISADYNKIAQALKSILIENKRIIQYGFTEQEYLESKDWLLDLIKSHIDELPSDEIYYKCYNYLIKGIVPVSFDFERTFVNGILPGLTIDEINSRYKEYTANMKPLININCNSNKTKQVLSVFDIENVLESVNIQQVQPYIYKNDSVKDVKLPEMLSGGVIKQSINNEIGTTEWTLSNGIHVVMKPTTFKKDEIEFLGLLKPDISFYKRDKYSSILNELEIPTIIGLGGVSPSDFYQLLTGKRISLKSIYSENKQGIKGYTSCKDFETALKLINLCFSSRSWNSNDTIYRNSTTTGLQNSKMFNDTVNTYSGFTSFDNSKKIPINQLNRTYKILFRNPSDYTFLISGSFKPEEIKPLIEKYIGSLANIKKETENQKTFTSNDDKSISPDWWKTSRRSCVFTNPTKNSISTILIRCQGGIDPKEESILYGYIAQRLLVNRMKNIIREKFGAAYSFGSYNNIVNANFIQLSIFFNIDPQNLKQIENVAFDEFKNFLVQGVSLDELNIIKSKIVKQRTDELNMNSWWVDNALYDYYFNKKNIISTYVQEVDEVTTEKLKSYTKKIYQQGNIIDVVMKPL